MSISEGNLGPTGDAPFSPPPPKEDHPKVSSKVEGVSKKRLPGDDTTTIPSTPPASPTLEKRVRIHEPKLDTLVKIAKEERKALKRGAKRTREEDEIETTEEKKFASSDESTEDLSPKKRTIQEPKESLLSKLEKINPFERNDWFGIKRLQHLRTTFQELSDDTESLDCIEHHREIMADIFTNSIDKTGEKRESLVARVSNLSNPYSDAVLHLENGVSTFSIPGGCASQKVIYEIRMVQDTATGENTYYFIIHNTSNKFIESSLYSRIHGRLRVTDSQGAEIGKTSVAIKVPRDALNWKFFEEILGEYNEESLDNAYKAIEKHLLEEGHGVIERSPEEARATLLYEKMRSETAIGRIERTITTISTNIECIRALKSKCANEKELLEQDDTELDIQLEELESINNALQQELSDTIDTLNQYVDDPKTKKRLQELRASDAEDRSEMVLQLTRSLATFITINQLADGGINLSNDEAFRNLQVGDSIIEASRQGPERQMAQASTMRTLEILEVGDLVRHLDLSNSEQADLFHKAQAHAKTLLGVDVLLGFTEEVEPGKKRTRAEKVEEPSEKPKKLARVDEDEDEEEETITYTPQPRSEPILTQAASFIAKQVVNISRNVLWAFIGIRIPSPPPSKPIENLYNSKTSPQKLFVNFSLKKYIENPQVGKTRQEELHERFDGTEYDLSLHKRDYARRFQDNFQHMIDDPEGLERIVRHREICVDIANEDVTSLLNRIDCLPNPTSSKVVHLANGGATLSFSGGCKEHHVIYEIKWERSPITNEFEYIFVIHNRGFGAGDDVLHGKLCITTSEGVNYSKASVPIQVTKEQLNRELFEALLKSNEDETMDRSYNYIKEHLLVEGGENIVRSADELAAIELFESKQTMRKELRRIGEAINLEKTQLQSIDTLRANIPDSSTLFESLKIAADRNLQSEIEKLPELLDAPGFELFTQEERDKLKALVAKKDYDELIETISHIVQRTTGYLLQSELEATGNTLLETDDTFSSDQIFGTCTESSKTGPEKQMASSNTRRLLKLYTIQELAEKVHHTQGAVPNVQDKKDLLHLADLRKAHLWKKVSFAPKKDQKDIKDQKDDQ